jgi:ComF family protein
MACRVLLPLNDEWRRAVWLCGTCEDLIEPLYTKLPPPPATVCTRCGVPLGVCADTNIPANGVCSQCRGKAFHFTYNRSIFTYDGILRDIIRDIKFRNKKNHARALGRLWAAREANAAAARTPAGRWLPENAVLVPVPLHPKKQRERGFNQAEILARELSKGLSLPVENALKRVVNTLPQAGLHPALRAENVADAFCMASRYTVENKVPILVDDIYTTGASLNECARTLKAHGAKEVVCMSLTVTIKGE